MELNKKTAEAELKKAAALNPGPWTDHSRYVALACRNIASRCDNLSAEKAWCYGLLHDIGRYAGVTSERHLTDGFLLCMDRGWEKRRHLSVFRGICEIR